MPPPARLRPPPDLRPGAMIGEKYRIERELGRGGFGVVLRAIHLTLNQRVAIKVLTEEEGSTEAEWAEDAARFRREAMATAALKSTHVVRVLDVDVLPDGRAGGPRDPAPRGLGGGYPYIVMEYLEGRTLHELVYATRTPLPVEDAVDYIVQVLAALADAHGAGIVHRDLKPANVFLAKGAFGSTVAKVLDFGVSKMIASATNNLTRTGAVVGTVAYMAPEQMVDSKRVDGRADIWSAGLILYETLARAHPFGGSKVVPKIAAAVLNQPTPSIRAVRPDVPVQLEAVLNRMLEKAPERRFQTAAAAAAALAPLAPVRSRPVLEEIRRARAPMGAALAASKSAKRTPSRFSIWDAVTLIFATALGVLAFLVYQRFLRR